LRHIRRIEGPGKMAVITGARVEAAADVMVKVARAASVSEADERPAKPRIPTQYQ